jgi:hypothetical protein
MMDWVSIAVLIVVALIGLSGLVDVKSILGSIITKEDEEEEVVVPVKPAVVTIPVPDLDTHDENSIVGIVAGWNRFKSQCQAAKLEQVVKTLDSIFPMLIKVMEDDVAVKDEE